MEYGNKITGSKTLELLSLTDAKGQVGLPVTQRTAANNKHVLFNKHGTCIQLEKS